MKLKTGLSMLAGGIALFAISYGLTMHENNEKSQNQVNPEIKKGLVKDGELRIGLEGTYAPFSYKDKSGKLVGYDVDVAKAVAKELGLKPIFVQTKFDSLSAGLQSRKFDVVFNDMTETPERNKEFSFSKPYLKSEPVMIVKHDSDIHSIDDIKGKNASQTASSNYGKDALNKGAKIVSSPGFNESLDLVSTGKADVTLNANDAWSYYAKHNKHKSNLKAIKINDSDIKTTEAVPMLNKHNERIRKHISNAEDVLRYDGTLSKISKQYFDKDLTK